MNKRKSISRLLLCFAVSAACLSSQLTALAVTGGEDQFKGEVIDQTSFRQTIPTVYIHLDGGKEEFDKVNQSPDHSYQAAGTMDIVVPENFSYAGSDEVITGFTGLKMEYFRGRGNSTWEIPENKKPYKIKLDKKADIFGMGSSKHWALLANRFDDTLSRNRFSSYFSEGLGFDFTPSGFPVDVMLDDGDGGYTYLGSYYLAENVRIESGRLDLDLPAENETKEGDYLLAHQQGSGSKNIFRTRHGEALMNDTPNFDPDEDEIGTDAQRDYIRAFCQEAEDAIILGRVKDDAAPDGWREVSPEDYIDYGTTAKYLLLEDFSLNRDAFKSGSCYFYKKGDTEDQQGKLYFGPVWDLDLAYNSGSTAGFSINHSWAKALLKDEKFTEAVLNEWTRSGGLRDMAVEVSKDGGLLDKYAEELKTSAEQDRKVHPDVYRESPDFDEIIKIQKQWLQDRIKWYDENLRTELTDRYVTMTLKYGEGKYDYDLVNYTAGSTPSKYDLPDLEKEGYLLLNWLDGEGQEYTFDDPLEEDITLTANYISNDEATKAQMIFFENNHAVGRYGEASYNPRFEIFPLSAQDKRIKWTSSNEKVAVPNEFGDAFFTGLGKTTITALLPNGREFSYELEVVDEPSVPESISFAADTLEMTAGERTQMDYTLSPAGSAFDNIQYTYEALEGTSPVYVDEFGVVTALAPGKAKVTATATTYDRSSPAADPLTVSDEYIITVKEKAEKVNVTVVWNDGDNKDGIRPDSATLSVFAAGDFYKLVPVKEADSWQSSFDYLGAVTEYTVGVFTNDVLNGTDGEGTYSFDVTGSAAEGFTVTFTHTPLTQESSGSESSDANSDSSEPESSSQSESSSKADDSSKADSSSKPADTSKNGNPNTGAAISLTAIALAAGGMLAVRRKAK